MIESQLLPAGGALGALTLALLLGARHALDPDHLAAVSQIVLGDRRRGLRRSGIVGLCWGLGHALTLCALGLPVVLYGRHMPEALHRGAELTVGLLIVALGVRLFLRWREGELELSPALVDARGPETHGDAPGVVRFASAPVSHGDLHMGGAIPAGAGAAGGTVATAQVSTGRTPLAAFGVGLVHGVGGSAGVGVLAVASMSGPAALATLLLFAVATAVSMAGSALAFGYLVTREPLTRRFQQLLPALALAGAGFGVWYTATVVMEALAV